MEGARDLIEDLKGRGHAVVLASSAKAEEVEHYLDLLDARELADGWTTSADVEATKPEPDLVHAALEQGRRRARRDGRRHAVGRRGGAHGAASTTIAVLTGGFSEQELREAGAVAVYDSIVGLREGLADSPLG